LTFLPRTTDTYGLCAFPILQLVIQLTRLLIRTGAIGDFILSLPALESLRADRTEVWCAEQNVPLARFAHSAQSIVASGLDRLGLLPADDVVERLRGFDSVISWYGTNRPDFRELTQELGLPFQFLPALPSGGGHAVEFYNEQARQLGGKPESRFPKIGCPAAERTFAVIHPFASNQAKRAPLAIFESAARRLAETMPVHWLAGPEEELEGAVRIENLYELACWLRRARIFVGNDSGISHLAAAVGTPVQAFFRTTDPRVWAPRGPSVNTTFV
jgi:ADP-heptose:LPS heptosyltransferase